MSTPPSASFAQDLPVVITGLGGVETTVPGRIADISAQTIALRAAHALAVGRPLKIEAEDTLWLGEVLHCEQDGDEYRVVVNLAHALYDLGDLARLAERFAGNSARTRTRDASPRNASEPTTVARH